MTERYIILFGVVLLLIASRDITRGVKVLQRSSVRERVIILMGIFLLILPILVLKNASVIILKLVTDPFMILGGNNFHAYSFVDYVQIALISLSVMTGILMIIMSVVHSVRRLQQ